MNLHKHRLAGFMAAAAALAAIPGPVSGAWPFSPGAAFSDPPSDNPWGPPSAKPVALRDEEDLRKLRLAQERRARKMKGRK